VNAQPNKRPFDAVFEEFGRAKPAEVVTEQTEGRLIPMRNPLAVILLPLGLLVSGCNLFLELTPIPTGGDADIDLATDAGQTGDDSNSDTNVNDAAPDSDAGIENQGPWKFVATGTHHSCAISKMGETYCWGYGGDHQLGNGDIESSAVPVLVPTPGFELRTLTLHEEFSCGLDTDDELWCWGSFGNFEGSQYDTPTHIMQGQWKKIDASRTHACALSMNDELWCWGHNHAQQMMLADGSTPDDVGEPSVIDRKSDNPIIDFAVGGSITCILYADRVDCRGSSVDGSSPDSGEISIPLTFAATRIEAGEHHLCVLDDTGQAQCVGSAQYIAQFRESATPTEFAKFRSAPNLRDLSTGNESACGIDTDGHLTCWGANHRGYLGRGFETNNFAPFAPDPTLSERTYTQVSSIYEHTCALTVSGNIDCWGLGTYGRLGDGELGFTEDPVAMIAARSFVKVELGNYHTCGLQADGGVACWGRGFYQGLGNGTLDHQPDPVDVPGVDARFLAVGGYVGCAVNKDNTVACWGLDEDGLLGNGSRSNALLPDVQDFVPTDPIAGITVGQNNACYWLDIADNTTINGYCWGRDSTLGTTGSGLTPVLLSNHMSRADIRAGTDHVCATNFSDLGICWGLNAYGQLGNGNTNNSGTAVALVGGQPTKFKIVQAADGFSCGIDLLNKLWCWGEGGRLGDGTGTQRLLPMPSLLEVEVKDLGGQAGSMCAITMSDELYCWGSNRLGAAGVGRSGTIYTPTRVNLPEPVVDVDGESSSMCAVGESGKVYCWGEQTFYRAGDHVFGMKTSPSRVIDPI